MAERVNSTLHVPPVISWALQLPDARDIAIILQDLYGLRATKLLQRAREGLLPLVSFHHDTRTIALHGRCPFVSAFLCRSP